MTRSDRRHVARPVSPLRAVVLWALPALALAAAVLIYAGAPVVATASGCAGLFVVVLVVYVLDRSGLMRPPPVQRGTTPPALAAPSPAQHVPPRQQAPPPPQQQAPPPGPPPVRQAPLPYGQAPPQHRPPPPGPPRVQRPPGPPAAMPVRPDDAAADGRDR